ncbi:WPP domain-interacting protein 1 isoform X2 [Prosopis cineraria]|uniref:WPP domain-interacting protein 1 isoform X2 n=1 Tax=Prosopis cineraria TaxID=364024 RepID=UPI00240ED15A|nr:WPP domain-interacting protein 1 isoform X2 [Prosopis cineraria]
MDLESECSISAEENEVGQNKSPHDGENGAESNLSCPDGDSTDQKGKLAGLDGEEPQRLSGTNLSESSHPTTKGYGLKKWRRIKRDVVKDQNTYLDSSKLLKRGLSGVANSTKAQPFPHDIQQNSEGSIGSSNVLKNVGFTYGLAVRGSSSDSKYAVGSAFAVGTDSENSEDRSSKSSTAASAPHRYAKENSQSRNIGSNVFANSTQKVQHGKGQIESSKKHRGERVKARKQNSHSSTDSDSRSSNVNRNAFTVTSNGKHWEESVIYHEGNSGDAHTNEHFPDEVHVGYCKENVVEDEGLFQGNLATKFSWDLKEEKSDSKQPSMVGDPLVESILSLQSVQEALAEEVQKLREIGHEHLSPGDESIKCATAAAEFGSVDPKFHESWFSGQSEVEGIKQTASSFLEHRLMMSLTENVNNLELKLEETQRILAAKNSRIAELETSLRNDKPPSIESSTLVHLPEEYREADFDLDELFRQKIESEVECLLITKMMHDLKVEADFHLKQLEELEALSRKQAQFLPKLVEAESKASVLKNQSEELENHHGGTLEVLESFMMQKRVYKVTFYFWVQFLLLILAFWFFTSQLAPNAKAVVPT